VTVAVEKPLTLEQRVEEALRKRALTTTQIRRLFGLRTEGYARVLIHGLSARVAVERTPSDYDWRRRVYRIRDEKAD